MLFQTSVAFLQRNTDNYNMKALCRSEKDRPTLADKLTGGRLQKNRRWRLTALDQSTET